MVKNLPANAGDLGSVPQRGTGEIHGQRSVAANYRSMKSQCRTQLSKFHFHLQKVKGFLGSACEKESICQCRTCKRHRLDLWVGKIPLRTAWKTTPVFLLENGNPLQSWASHGQRSLASHSPQGHKESDTTEVRLTHTENKTKILS